MDLIPTGSVFVLTGLSGAGKSLALKCMEDLGFFCVDNLLPALIPTFVKLCQSSDIRNIAFVVDIRSSRFFKELMRHLKELPGLGFSFRLLFFEASDEILIRRFSESRRSHPVRRARIIDSICYEKKALESLRKMADLIIDTSGMTPNGLKKELVGIVDSPSGEIGRLSITIVAFGFKHGVPIDADLIYDVRFLPNPYYVDTLKHLTGNDAAVSDYVMGFAETSVFLEKLFDFNGYLVPQYVQEGKTRLTIAVGCTGGRHRSVVVANKLADFLLGKGYNVQLEYREIQK